jgi:hypothetical protein
MSVHSAAPRTPYASSMREDGYKDGPSPKEREFSKCTLTCCAPDGSPLQGHSFVIGESGSGLGRKATNAIGLFVTVEETDESGLVR